MGMMRVTMAAAAVCLLAGCAGQPAIEQSATPTPSITVPRFQVPPGVFLDGYPKVVRLKTLPEPVAYEFSELDKMPKSTPMVAVAPGVWTLRIPGTDLEQNAAEGGYAGYCAPIKAQNRRLEAAGLTVSGFSCH